jgi:hypothetical protein
MKIKLLYALTIAGLINGTIYSQPNLDPNKGRTCATETPSAEWIKGFNKSVEKYKSNLQAGKAQQPAPWVIPVVVHIVHNGQAVGVGDNISQAQVIDQINILNADFAGTGFNNGNAPAAFAGVKADCQITFCLAVKDPTGGILPEPGIDRIDRNAKGWTNGPYATAYINATIKPNTIWDPTRYCNMWVMNLGGGLLGYATFPAGISLTGVAGGGNATNDGVVMLNTAFGSIGTATPAPYNKGRTTTHELGHWLGLIHTWGDDGGACTGNDFCNDTPNSANSVFGCPALPFLDACATAAPGAMIMNFMDYTDDACMYMFTNDQRTRMHTAMTQGTYRSLLGTHGLCSNGPPPPRPAPGPAIANFSVGSIPCVGQSFTPINNSTGDMPLTYNWSCSPPTVSYSPNNTVATPAITFTAPGNYVLTLVATNTAGTSSYSTVIQNVAKCKTCLDTARVMTLTDTLMRYSTVNDINTPGCQTGYAGFLAGTNCYQDKEFAQFFPSGTYSDTPNPQVYSVIVLFDSLKTRAVNPGTTIDCKLYGGTMANGPQSFIGLQSVNLGMIAAAQKTTTIKYWGSKTYTISGTKIIPYKINLATPLPLPPTGFFTSITVPPGASGDSVRIFTNSRNGLLNDSSAWLLNSNNNWKTLRSYRKSKVQLGIIPLVSCRPIVGIEENSQNLTSNVSIVPNPNNGEFNIVFTLNNTSDVEINIYNSLGQSLGKQRISDIQNDLFTVNLSDKPDGIYFVEITSGKEKTTKKVIVTK